MTESSETTLAAPASTTSRPSEKAYTWIEVPWGTVEFQEVDERTMDHLPGPHNHSLVSKSLKVREVKVEDCSEDAVQVQKKCAGLRDGSLLRVDILNGIPMRGEWVEGEFGGHTYRLQLQMSWMPNNSSYMGQHEWASNVELSQDADQEGSTPHIGWFTDKSNRLADRELGKLSRMREAGLIGSCTLNLDTGSGQNKSIPFHLPTARRPIWFRPVDVDSLTACRGLCAFPSDTNAELIAMDSNDGTRRWSYTGHFGFYEEIAGESEAN